MVLKLPDYRLLQVTLLQSRPGELLARGVWDSSEDHLKSSLSTFEMTRWASRAASLAYGGLWVSPGIPEIWELSVAFFSWGSCRDHGWFCFQSSERDSSEVSAVVLCPGFSLESTGKILTSLVWGGTLVTAFSELLRWVICAASIENHCLI